MIEVTGIDRDGESRSLLSSEPEGHAASLAALMLETGWKYARLTCCGRVLAVVTLCSCDGGPPARQVVMTGSA